MNMHRGSSTVYKIKEHWIEFRKLWERPEEITNFAIPLGVAISIVAAWLQILEQP